MADDINRKITVDVEVNTDGQQQINQYKAAFDNLRNSISNLSNPVATLSNSISSFDKDVAKLTGSIDKLTDKNKKFSESGGKFKDTVKNVSETFDTFCGAIEIVKKSVSSLEGAISGGLTVLITWGPELLKFIGALFKGKDAIDQTKMSMDTMNRALESSDYSNAIQQINDLKINIGLAKKGFLDKKQVLLQYNDTVGKTMGAAANLNMVESKIIKNGDAYIKMTLLKASAQLALEDAAKKAYEVEQDRLKSDNETLSFIDKAEVYIKDGALAGGIGLMNAIGQAPADLAVEATKKRKEEIDETSKQKDALLSIARKFKTEEAAIAREAGFDIFSGQITKKAGTENSNVDGGRAEALNEAEKMLKDSLTRQLQTTYESYGRETTALNDHYQDELSRLNKLLADKKIALGEYQKVTAQLESEYHEKLTAIASKYNQEDKDRIQQAQNELAELTIKGMREGTTKQVAELQQQQTEKNQELEKLDAESIDRVTKLNTEISAVRSKDPNADITELQKQLDAEYQIMAINCKKEETLEKQTADAIKKIKAVEGHNKSIQNDQDAVDAAKDPGAKQTAEKKLITDKYQFEIEQAQGNATQIKEIQNKLDKEILTLDTRATEEKNQKSKKAAEDLAKFEQEQEKKIADAGFKIISDSIKQASEAKIAGLEKDKDAELNNNSLTSAQKLAIEQKYKQQEAQVKVKAFKQEQEASIAQAIINGALAITKGTSQTGVLASLFVPAIIADTAIQVATIAAQKPPAYAKGGLHYTSDGRGGVLPGYSRSDNTNAYLRSGEGIVVSEAMQVPWARNLVSAINVGFGGRDFSVINPGRGYVVGGIFTDGGDANRYYNQPVHDQKNLANSIAYQMINNFPPVYVDVKDINNQQNILAQTINRVNL